MKKSTLLKLAVMFVAMFIYAGSFAQTNAGAGVEGSASVIFTTGGTVTMAAGTTIPLYAKPDPIYHSTWTYNSDWSLTAGFIWNWSYTGGDLLDLSFAPGIANVRDNYVEISAIPGITGNYVVSVTEQASPAYGSCEGAAQTQNITVVAQPDATITGAGTSVTYCLSDPLIPTAVAATITGGWQNYRLAWTLEIATLGAGLVKDNYFALDKSTIIGVGAFAVSYTQAIPEAVAASGVHSILSVAGGFTLAGTAPATRVKPTVYTYTLTAINDQAHRQGDYIGFGGSYAAPLATSFSYNVLVGQTYTIQINPAPATGPIYHIPTAWGA